MAMTETKKWNQSLGIWAAMLLPVVALALPIFGQADLGAFVSEESTGIVEWLTAIGTVIGSALAFWGRYRARKVIE